MMHSFGHYDAFFCKFKLIVYMLTCNGLMSITIDISDVIPIGNVKIGVSNAYC